MKKNNIFIFLFISIFILSFISSNGLQVLNSTISVEKKNGIEKEIIFYLKNTDSVVFNNISFIENPIIKMNVIPELQSNQIAMVTGVVFGNITGNYSIKIKGYYISNLGIANITHIVNIYYDSGVQPCEISMVKGDSINWKNLANREIKIINKESQVEIVTIPTGNNSIRLFSDVINLKYYVSWFGFQFTDVCSVYVLSDSGYINNPTLDGILNMNLSVTYEDTVLESTFLLNNYTMDFYNTQEGVFLIKNVGNKDAYNIFMKGEWFSFNQNNFSLAPGVSKTISYTIRPTAQYTNQTNKTYTKQVEIIGNFPKLTKDFFIFLNYANIDSGNFTQSDNLLAIVEKFCKENPTICSGSPKVIYRDTNDSSVNVTIATNQLKQIFEYLFQSQEDFKVFQMYVKENLNALNNSLSNVTLQNQNVTNDISSLRNDATTSNSFVMFILIGVSALTVLGCGGYLIYFYAKQRKLEALRRM